MTIAEVLNAAADEIEQRGWYPGHPRAEADGIDWTTDHSGPTCAGVAIEEVDGAQSEAYYFFAKYIGLSLRPSWGIQPRDPMPRSIIEWNDEQEDQATVVAKLREAAKAAEVQGG